MLPRKGSLTKIFNRVIFVAYCLLKKINTNWVLLVREHMVECFDDTNSTTSLSYDFLSLVDLSDYILHLLMVPMILEIFQE